MDTTSSSAELLKIVAARRFAASGEGRRLRLLHQLTGPEVARAIGVGQGTLWRWEHGQRQPRGAAAVRYAEFLTSLEDIGASA